MSKIADLASRVVTARPLITIIVLAVVTLGLGSGVTRLAPQADNTIFLPTDSEVAAATDTIDTLFSGTKDTLTATVIFRGDALTPAGLAQIDATVDGALSDPAVVDVLAQPNPAAAPTDLAGRPARYRRLRLGHPV